MIFVGESLQKSNKNVSGKFGETRAKILRTAKVLPAPTPICQRISTYLK